MPPRVALWHRSQHGQRELWCDGDRRMHAGNVQRNGADLLLGWRATYARLRSVGLHWVRRGRHIRAGSLRALTRSCSITRQRALPSAAVTEGKVEVYDGIAGIALGDVLLTLWRTPARRERIRRVTHWTEQLMGNTEGSIAACQFLLPTASPPDSEGRSETWRGFRIVEPRARRLITVPLGDQMWRGAVRTIIRTAVAMWGRSQLIKIASSESEAFAMLEQVASTQTPARQQLEDGLESLRAALRASGPT